MARDLYERAMTFGDYVAYYTLARSEGLVLRYLSDAYKALTQTVPEDAKTEELYDLTEWLGELVRQVDSSLLDEWERLTNPDAAAAGARRRRRRHAAAGHGQHPGLPGPGPQRAVPPGRAGRAAPLRHPGRARRRRRLDGAAVAATPWPATSPTTPTSAPDPTPAARPC